MMLQGGILRSGTVCILTGLIYLIEWLKDRDRWSGGVIFFIFGWGNFYFQVGSCLRKDWQYCCHCWRGELILVNFGLNLGNFGFILGNFGLILGILLLDVI